MLGFAANGQDPTRVHAVNVCGDEPYFQKRVGTLLRDTIAEYELPPLDVELNIWDGHVGTGYGETTPEDLRFYVEFARREGIMLDPCYTGKAMRGILAEIEKDPARFGEHVLFLHSGGLFENFAYAEQYAPVCR